ncbi:TrbI/VirB10 family protein [Ruegeria sp.]|uniref:TrbI/VirB10 family protein n=1 Tax=Ruegeria sp. TaxID=1879320 RepID=UPI003B00DE08
MSGKQEGAPMHTGPGRRIVRFRKSVVIGGTAIVSTGLLIVTLLALQTPALRIAKQAEELYNTGTNPTPDGLAALPGDYSQVKPAMSDIPELGPPLPGDLGRPILEHQRQLGIAPGGQDQTAADQRAAQQAIAAKESVLFFRIENRPPQNATATGSALAVPQAMAPVMAGQPAPIALSGPGTSGSGRDPNHQRHKLDFLNRQDTGGIYSPHALQTPASPYQIMAGSVIAASLITGINSDLPGLVVAQVTENVHDTVTGRVLLIPQGARLIGAYDSVVAFGQSRALLVWQRIILPDGSSIRIDNLPATDAAGYAGLEDKVDHHTGRLLKGIAMATLLGVGTELTFGEGESDLVRAIRDSVQQNAKRAGQRITQKNLDIQPTITIRPGWPLRIIVQRDLILRPYHGNKG